MNCVGAVVTCQVPACTWPAELVTPIRVDVPVGGALELILCPLHADLAVRVLDMIRRTIDDLAQSVDRAGYWRTHVGVEGWSVHDEVNEELIVHVASEEVADRLVAAHNRLVNALDDAAMVRDIRHPEWPSLPRLPADVENRSLAESRSR